MRIIHEASLASLLLVSAAAQIFALDVCPDLDGQQEDVFDFIVVGAGAVGGPLAARLVENGYSVFLVDAGSNATGYNSTLPAYWPRATEDLATSLGYNITEYSTPGSRVAWYPRASALGGSTIHNAMLNVIAGTRGDFDSLVTMFNDSSWSRDSMQDYFKLVEKNEYLLQLLNSRDHGFDGWMEVTALPYLNLLHNLNPQLLSIFASLSFASGHPRISDLNALASDGAAGIASPDFTVDKNHVRSSVHNRLNAVHASQSKDGAPMAYGVEIADGPGVVLPVADGFQGKQELELRSVYARHEVVVSAGVFQSPQLVCVCIALGFATDRCQLMLSGIGDSRHLREFGIETVVDLPGVGSNLQDHDEISIIWKMKNDFKLLVGCKFLSDPEVDPCLRDWETTDHGNVYAFSPALNAIIDYSNRNQSAGAAPDTLTYIGSAYFEGIVPGMSEKIVDHPNGFSSIVLLAHPSSRGYVRLSGSHPQDALDIAKRHFQAPDGAGARDLEALVLGLERMQALVSGSWGVSTWVEERVFPPEGANLTQHVLDHVFGHHACCTNAMGADDDSMAVLDGDLRVRGTNRLRVVDLSSWKDVPGFFVTTPMYMMSEKAAVSLIRDAQSRTKQRLFEAENMEYGREEL
ncbi:Choline dehydrogenase [Mycena chlorophos]|uniref:Choline dehydrogenase n=1 Tax=Mycena chlorophos TaxID=658473 RepID=A0A8H6TX51_MYCCL|nr:Choline dehydrogenase [Mycena chlorophos]